VTYQRSSGDPEDGRPIAVLLSVPMEVVMLETVRRAVPISALPVDGLVAVGTGAAFFWLLAQGYIRPLAIYMLELYLSF
jgi:hypothetical protein